MEGSTQGLQEFRRDINRRWTDQGRADNSWCFWSAYHMLGSKLNTLQALAPSSQLSYAWGTLYDTTDQETEVGRWSHFLQVMILCNLQRQDLNPCLSDWLACINHSTILSLRMNERLCCENGVRVLFRILFQHESEATKYELSHAREDN